MTELELLRKGDKKFIQTIYKDCFKSISTWIKKNSGTDKEAEDVFQDAMMAVYQKSTESDFSLSCKLSTFIFSVSKKIWLHKLRSKSRYMYNEIEELDLSETETLAADQLMIEAEMDSIYKKSFQQLSKECKTMLTHFFNGLSMKEIMLKMGIATEGNVRKKKFRCKNELIKLVENDLLYQELVNKNT